MLWTVLALLLSSAAYAANPILWRDPGAVEKQDLAGTVGFAVAAPRPPFTFEREDLSGTQPKIFVHDANGTQWNVKFGFEVKTESFSWRIVRALGYFAAPSFYVREGRLESFHPITRKTPSLADDGRFQDGRFQWRTPTIHLVSHRSWHWDHNPFAHTKELSGLKMLLMLLSNYDNKDARVGAAGGPNTGLFEYDHGQLWYAFTDWGAGLGHWGDRSGQTHWRCEDFTAQSAQLVRGVQHGQVLFGFEGHIPHFNEGISTADVAWLMRYLGRITDDQLRSALRAAGASAAEEVCFAKALRLRIEALRAVSGKT